MNIRLVQQYAIIGAAEAVEMAAEVNTAYHEFIFFRNADEPLRRAIKKCNDVVAVCELMVDEIGIGVSPSTARDSLDSLIAEIKADASLTDLRSCLKGIELAGANSDLCKFLVDDLIALSKVFSEIARFGIHTINPETHKDALGQVVVHIILITVALEGVSFTSNWRDEEAIQKKKAKVMFNMRTTEQAGLL